MLGRFVEAVGSQALLGRLGWVDCDEIFSEKFLWSSVFGLSSIRAKLIWSGRRSVVRTKTQLEDKSQVKRLYFSNQSRSDSPPLTLLHSFFPASSLCRPSIHPIDPYAFSTTSTCPLATLRFLRFS